MIEVSLVKVSILKVNTDLNLKEFHLIEREIESVMRREFGQMTGVSATCDKSCDEFISDLDYKLRK